MQVRALLSPPHASACPPLHLMQVRALLSPPHASACPPLHHMQVHALLSAPQGAPPGAWRGPSPACVVKQGTHQRRTRRPRQCASTQDERERAGSLHSAGLLTCTRSLTAPPRRLTALFLSPSAQAVMHQEGPRAIMLCQGCFLVPAFCCCRSWARNLPLRHQVFVYMHHNEWCVSSSLCPTP